MYKITESEDMEIPQIDCEVVLSDKYEKDVQHMPTVTLKRPWSNISTQSPRRSLMPNSSYQVAVGKAVNLSEVSILRNSVTSNCHQHKSTVTIENIQNDRL